ncbi:MAG: DUF6049 family protein [Actinomycetota bacterium]
MSRLAAISLSLALVLSPLSGAAVRAQTPTATPDGITLELLSQPVWHEPGDRLDIRVRVTNGTSTPLEGFRVQLNLFDRMVTRSDLHRSFEGLNPALAPGAFPRDLFDQSIAPGDSRVVTFNERVDQSLFLLSDASEPGVYPLTISLVGADLTLLDSITTALIFITKTPPSPLGLVAVVPINSIPARLPDGVFHPDELGDWPLEEAISDGGWLAGLLDALERSPRRLRLGIAPVPRLIEELADMSNGFRRASVDEFEEVAASDEAAENAAEAIDRLTDLLEREGIEGVLTPYAFPDLPALRNHLSSDVATEHIVLGHLPEGERVLEEAFGIDFPDRWLFPPGGRLDAGTLEVIQARRTGTGTGTNILWSGESLEAPPDPDSAGCPTTFASSTCPIAVETFAGGVEGWLADEGLQERMGRLINPGDTALDLQRFFAETAMIWAELPGTEHRVAHFTVGSLWQPPPELSTSFFTALAEAPWLKPMAPTRALRTGLEPVERDILESLPPSSSDPGTSYFSEVEEAERVVDSFATLEPPSTLIGRLTHNVLTAESRTWWTDPELIERGLAYARATRAETESDLSKISVESFEEITLTSRTGTVSLLVRNETGYPVTLEIELRSPKLTFAEPVITQTFSDEATPLEVGVTAQSSGIFPLQVFLKTPDGLDIEPNGAREISVRSTELNRIALVITVSALAFLILFYVSRWIRRRRRPAQAPAS